LDNKVKFEPRKYLLSLFFARHHRSEIWLSNKFVKILDIVRLWRTTRDTVVPLAVVSFMITVRSMLVL